MIPVIDQNQRHVGWTGERSEVHDRIMARRRQMPAHLINRTFNIDGETYYVVSLKNKSTWQEAGDGECVTLTEAEARELSADCRSEMRHPGPMAWGLVLFLEQFSYGNVHHSDLAEVRARWPGIRFQESL